MNPRLTQKIAFAVLLLATLLVVLPVVVILLIIVVKGASAISWDFLFSMPTDGMTAGGIFPAILGTLYLVLGAIVFAVPLGVMAAIYLVEYSSDNWLSRLVKLSIVNLAGVPSVVYGLFGLGIFVTFFRFGASILSGSLTLGIMILPVIITSSREALESVPRHFRTVSLSVLPHALPGILTGMILGLGRAAGETAPILFTVAAFYLPRLPQSLFDQTMALPYHLYVISTQVPGIAENVRYGTALVLLVLVLLLNLAAILVRSRFRRNKKW
jgi:phosphate transport system permease protein